MQCTVTAVCADCQVYRQLLAPADHPYWTMYHDREGLAYAEEINVNRDINITHSSIGLTTVLLAAIAVYMRVLVSTACTIGTFACQRATSVSAPG